MIYFNSKLFRGNRCVKNSSTSLDAFSTPNIPPLAVLETDINSEYKCSIIMEHEILTYEVLGHISISSHIYHIM